MEFSLDKCAIAVMKGGKQIKNQNMPIDDKTSIQSHEETSYKFPLGKLRKDFPKGVELIPGRPKVSEIQKISSLGTAHILQKFWMNH